MIRLCSSYQKRLYLFLFHDMDQGWFMNLDTCLLTPFSPPLYKHIICLLSSHNSSCLSLFSSLQSLLSFLGLGFFSVARLHGDPNGSIIFRICPYDLSNKKKKKSTHVFMIHISSVIHQKSVYGTFGYIYISDFSDFIFIFWLFLCIILFDDICLCSFGSGHLH